MPKRKTPLSSVRDHVRHTNTRTKDDAVAPLYPSAALLAKIGSILVHTSEHVGAPYNVLMEDDFRAFTILTLIRDSDVQAWLDGMQRLGLLPVKRS